MSVCLLVRSLRLPLPPGLLSPGAVPGPGHTSRRDRARCRRGSTRSPPLAGSRPTRRLAGWGRDKVCRRREKFGTSPDESIPAQQPARTGGLPSLGIKAETKRRSCPGPSGVISPRGQKGTHRIAASRVARAPHGRSSQPRGNMGRR